MREQGKRPKVPPDLPSHLSAQFRIEAWIETEEETRSLGSVAQK